MAWNRSAHANGNTTLAKTSKMDATAMPRKSHWLQIIVCTLAVTCGGIVLLLFLARPGETTSSAPQEKLARKMQRVTKVKSPPATNKPAAAPTDDDDSIPVDERGRPLLTNILKNVPGRRTPRPVRIISSSGGTSGKTPIFHTMSDNHLEQLVNYQPGERFLAVVSPAEIAHDFMVHVADKIEISPDDSPEVVERKRRYVEVREDIKKAIREGEDLEEMIVEARRTLDKIASMREEYIRALDEAEKEGASDEELDDLATAATMLLKEHGANPILSPNQQMKIWEEQVEQQ